MIDITKLTESDLKRKVIYTAYPGAKPEKGIITSFTETTIFVDYQNVFRGQATPAARLDFIKENSK